MILKMVALILACPMVHVVNLTNKWTKVDVMALNYAVTVGCKKHNPKLPCDYLFTKKSTRTYSLGCGPKVMVNATEADNR